MDTTPAESDSVNADQRWIGRARVATALPAAAVSRGLPPTQLPPTQLPPDGAPGSGKPRRRWGRIALVTVLVLALIAAGIAVAALLWVKSVDDNLKRTDSIDSMVTGERPTKVAAGALNILLLGSDSRDPDQPTDEGGNWRTDTVVLMHIPASHDKAYLVSFPRDLWIHIPRNQAGTHGNTTAKINAATAWGGVPLMVETIEDYTGVRVDHLALIDFAGFVRVTDALGGVDLNIEKTIKSIHPPFRTFEKGMRHLDGAEALDYVRQRKQFADGDFARMRHQQEFLKAILDKAASSGTVTNLGTLRAFVGSVSDAITVDSEFSLIDVGWQFRSLRGSDLTFITSPHQGTGMVGDQSVVFPDPEKASSLFGAIVNDSVGNWLTQNPPK